jgi:hypothetical protein
MYKEFRCRQGVKHGERSNEMWGGNPVVVLFENDIQLPTVLDSKVYNTRGKRAAAIHGVYVWTDSNGAVVLFAMFSPGPRRTESNLFQSEYKIDSQKAKWLQNCQWHILKKAYGQQYLDQMMDNLFVFPDHKSVWDHNQQKLSEANQNYQVATKDCLFV